MEMLTSHSEAVSHDVAKEAAEHEEHLTHVLHQLQNKPWAAFYVACLFSYSFQWGFGFLCYSTGGTSGLVPVLFRVMQGITAFLPSCPLYLLYFNSLWTTL
jgi:hypothetical protein